MAVTIGGVIAALGLSASCVWLGAFLGVLGQRGKATWLAGRSSDPPSGGWPSLAVIFAARNEEPSVARATRSLLAQDYPGLEVIAVDDRSHDATGSILDDLATTNPRLRVIHVHELPRGWLGKNHALQTAAEATDADWLLLTDADVVFAPGTLRRALAWAVEQDADHVTVAPEVPTESIGERLFLAMFRLMFAIYSPVWAVENRACRAHLGIGAFNLVHAEAFRAIGGLRRLALTVDEDMRLGQALKAAGFTTRVLFGRDAVSVRWQVGLRGMIHGLEKNFFAALGFSLPKALLGALVLLWLGAGPHAGLVTGPWWSRAGCLIGVAAICLLLKVSQAWQGGVPWYYGLTLPLSGLLCAFALVRSVWLTLRRRGVRWREHLYPLGELKNHVRHREEWIREVWRSTR